VLLPLTQLCQMFEGPNNVILKRYHKLLDYDNLRRKFQSDKVNSNTNVLYQLLTFIFNPGL